MKPVSEFYKSRYTSDGLSPRCKVCDSERVKKIYYSDIDKSRAYGRRRYHSDIELNRMRQRADRIRLRQVALAYYGNNKCKCCGEADDRFLSIDHINGGGTKERKEGKGGGHFLYRRLRREGYPEGFQVLCYNCNVAKGIYGSCPHTLPQN